MKERVRIWMSSGRLFFTTTHFSTYTIAEELFEDSENSRPIEDDSEFPFFPGHGGSQGSTATVTEETSDDSMTIIAAVAAIVVIIAVCAAMVLRRN